MGKEQLLDNQNLTRLIQSTDNVKPELKERLIAALPKLTLPEKMRLVINLNLIELTNFYDWYEKETGEKVGQDFKKANLKLVEFLKTKADQAQAEKLAAKIKALQSQTQP